MICKYQNLAWLWCQGLRRHDVALQSVRFFACALQATLGGTAVLGTKERQAQKRYLPPSSNGWRQCSAREVPTPSLATPVRYLLSAAGFPFSLCQVLCEWQVPFVYQEGGAAAQEEVTSSSPHPVCMERPLPSPPGELSDYLRRASPRLELVHCSPAQSRSPVKCYGCFAAHGQWPARGEEDSLGLSFVLRAHLCDVLWESPQERWSGQRQRERERESTHSGVSLGQSSEAAQTGKDAATGRES